MIRTGKVCLRYPDTTVSNNINVPGVVWSKEGLAEIRSLTKDISERCVLEEVAAQRR